MEKVCNECREPAARVRKGRCDACYMRLYRRGAPVRGDRCAACGERRLPALDLAKIEGAPVVLCGNCCLVLARTRPRLTSVEELKLRLEPRHAPERRASRLARPAPMQRMPAFDPSVD
jgi:hypothetical protein